MRRILTFAFLTFGIVIPALAQQPSVGMVQISPGVYEPLGPSNALSVNTVQVAVSATGTTAATPVTMPAVVGKTNYVCGVSIDSFATAATGAGITMTGILGGSMSFLQGVGASPAANYFVKTFFPCLPAAATNTAITITSAPAGTAGVTLANIWGFVR